MQKKMSCDDPTYAYFIPPLKSANYLRVAQSWRRENIDFGRGVQGVALGAQR